MFNCVPCNFTGKKFQEWVNHIASRCHHHELDNYISSVVSEGPGWPINVELRKISSEISYDNSREREWVKKEMIEKNTDLQWVYRYTYQKRIPSFSDLK